LAIGSIRVEADGVTLRVWADANGAVYHVQIDAPRELGVAARPEFWKRIDHCPFNVQGYPTAVLPPGAEPTQDVRLERVQPVVGWQLSDDLLLTIRDTGETITVHAARQHPGDRLVKNTWVPLRVRGQTSGRRNVLHIFKPLRPGQKRGVPWIAPILEPLRQLSQYTDAELKAAVDSAITSFFTKMDPEAFDDLFSDQDKEKIIGDSLKWDGKLAGDNQVINLLPGEEVQNFTPGRPNPQFDPFVQAILRQIGVALEITLRLLPKPARYRTLLAAYRSLEMAGEAVASVVASGLLPGAMEIMDRLASRGARILSGRALPYGDGITYWPLRGMVLGAATIHQDDTPEPAQDKILACVRDRDVADRLASAVGLSSTAFSMQDIAWAARRFLQTLAAEAPAGGQPRALQTAMGRTWCVPTILRRGVVGRVSSRA
jgi:hypothetical protein